MEQWAYMFREEKLAQLRTSFAEYFQLGSQRNIHPIKNGLNCSLL